MNKNPFVLLKSTIPPKLLSSEFSLPHCHMGAVLSYHNLLTYYSY